MATAFEAITTRQSWYASAAVAKYDAVEIGSDGKYQKANGTGLFAGICEYGAEAADRMITVVKGTFPCVCSGSVTAGAKLTVDTAHAGQMKTATSTDAVYGVALNAAAAGELVSIAMVEAPIPGSGK
jgi:hypothetical protein